jgi:tRNA A37 N6-isopentenylltransferase MiaA
MNKVLVITGMTGVGKTNIAKILANHLNGEIVSADSLQVINNL